MDRGFHVLLVHLLGSAIWAVGLLEYRPLPVCTFSFLNIIVDASFKTHVSICNYFGQHLHPSIPLTHLVFHISYAKRNSALAEFFGRHDGRMRLLPRVGLLLQPDERNALLDDAHQLFRRPCQRCDLSRHGTAHLCTESHRDQTAGLQIVRPGHLVAVTQIASFRLGQRGSSHYGVVILDAAYSVAGELCGEITHFRQEALALINKDVRYEFIALSLSGLHVRPYTGEERETKSCHDPNGTLLDTLHSVNVLLLERKEDVVHRKELGWIYFKDWARADRHWEIVVLG